MKILGTHNFKIANKEFNNEKKSQYQSQSVAQILY
jgi:hypothetical protein